MRVKNAAPNWSLYYLPERRTTRWLLDRSNSFFGKEAHAVVLHDVQDIAPAQLAARLQENLYASQVHQAA